jgi:molybdopterin converting factor small subunit
VLVRVKLFATLRKYAPTGRSGIPFEVEVPEGATIGDLVRHLQLPADEVKVMFVDARAQAIEYVLRPGAEVGIFPPVGGG